MYSCDTFVVTGDYTDDGRVIVAKNSDRSPNEANNMVYYEEQSHTLPTVQCTYIKIPQVPTTLPILLLQPHWMWGGEYGSNSFGVCIGNEAVFSTLGDPKAPSLLGMDLLRLGLERGKTAIQARQIIIDLLEMYGQGGNCCIDEAFYYNNSYVFFYYHPILFLWIETSLL